MSALRVSEAFAAKHPNGMFEVLSPYIMTGEGKEFDFYVLRRGSTEGTASVNIKAIEISAKYGDDFVLQERDALGFYHDLKKNQDNPTILENQVNENKNLLFTTDRIASGAGIDVYAFDETVSSAAADVESVNEVSENENVSETSAQDTMSIDEVLQKEEEVPVMTYSDDLGNYTSALHKMCDEATGKVTPTVSDEASYSLDDIFETKSKEEVQLANDAAEAFDGLEYTVDFKDGEAYKIIHLKITDDDVYEAQEAFGLSLYNPKNGAEIGEQNSSTIIIDDDKMLKNVILALNLKIIRYFPMQMVLRLN